MSGFKEYCISPQFKELKNADSQIELLLKKEFESLLSSNKDCQTISRKRDRKDIIACNLFIELFLDLF